MRLDFKVAEKLDISREKAKEVIQSEGVLVNGKIISKASAKVGEEEITFVDDVIKNIAVKPSRLKQSDIPLDVVFEDEFFMVINKQAGVSTHPPSMHGEGTIANAIIKMTDEDGLRPGIVHRLDKDTTGLLILAKTEKAKTAISKMIEEREVERRYLALCYGAFRLPSFKIDANITRDERDRIKMKICKTGGKNAITNVFVKQGFFNNHFSLVELKLETGRTHQIRLHLAHNGNSVIGDQSYGLKPPSFFDKFKANESLFNALINTKRQMLHAYSLSFIHPFTNNQIELKSPVPRDFEDLLSLFIPTKLIFT